MAPAPSVLSASALSVTKLQNSYNPSNAKCTTMMLFVKKISEKEYNVEYATLDEIYEKCDIISYHVPVLDSTRGMINKEAIDKMKQDAIIVNVARGDLMNNADVAEALNAGKIFVARMLSLREPPKDDDPLFSLNETGLARFSITPHIAGTTDDSFMRMSQWSYDNMKRIENGEKPINIVNGL